MKICKNGHFQHISGIFGRKKLFLKIGLDHILGIPDTHICAKNQKKIMMKSRENAKKPVFPAYKAFSAGKENMFLENRSLSHFRHCHFASVCKI